MKARRLFCDTSFFYASLDESDVNHVAAAEIVERLVEEAWSLHVTWDVISETATLLRYRKSHRAAATFLREILPDLHIVSVGDRVRQEAMEVFLRYGRERRLSFCDAISFVVVTSLLNHIPTLSFDEDFSSLGLNVIRSPSQVPP